MKSFHWIIMVLLLVGISGCEETDLFLATEAGVDAVKAVTLSDEQVRRLSRQAIAEADRKNSLADANDPYARRLQRLVGEHLRVGEQPFHFAVYRSPTVNAFAMGDGSIRVYSGLMDMLDDDELRFVMGHEMGHVVHEHIKKKMMVAYAASALRKGLASQQGWAGEISRSALGGFVQSLVGAQFSQQEEREADDYGLQFIQQNQYDEQAAVRALQKLVSLGNSHSFLSSHPAPDVRAARLAKRLAGEEVDSPALLSRLMAWLKTALGIILVWLEKLWQLAMALIG